MQIGILIFGCTWVFFPFTQARQNVLLEPLFEYQPTDGVDPRETVESHANRWLLHLQK